MSKISISIKSIKRGPIPDDGTMGTVLSKLGNTYKDTASIVEDDVSTFDIMVEESDDPEASFDTLGAVRLQFSLIDHSPETIKAVKGGEIVNGMWERPLSAANIEECYQIISQTDILYEIPRGRVKAIINDQLQKGAVGLIPVTVTALKPSGAGIKAFRVGPYQKPTVNAGNDANVVANNAALAGTATAFRGDIVSRAWTCVVKPNNAVAPTFTAAAQLNTNVTGLVNGVYKFRLTVKDENDFESYDEVQITVNIA